MRERAHIEVQDLTLAYGEQVIQRELNFRIQRGRIFVIMGGSGCGKSTLLRHLLGLQRPAAGKVFVDGADFWAMTEAERLGTMRRAGVLYQSGALWSSMTLAENLTLPLTQYTDVPAALIGELVDLKLGLVGLRGFGDHLPAELSGGMRKRAGLARALALDPEILFFDEPSAGLDPVTARRLDDLILQLRDAMKTTVVLVTHELPSIFALGDDSVFLDGEARTMIATGNPHRLLEHSRDQRVRAFLTRGEEA